MGSGVNGDRTTISGEILPAKISGYVFQDGPTIVIKQGDPMPEYPRDPRRQAHAGRQAAGRRGAATVRRQRLSADGRQRQSDHHRRPTPTAITSSPGSCRASYSVIEIQPGGYIAGIDTAGSKGGLVVNQLFDHRREDAEHAGGRSVADSAIVRITIDPGDAAVQYNFSEVLIKRKSTPPPAAAAVRPAAELAHADRCRRPCGCPSPSTSRGRALLSVPDDRRRSSAVRRRAADRTDYTWHLSVIDAGQPRSENSGDEFAAGHAEHATSIRSPGPAPIWTSRSGSWPTSDGVPIKTIRFGMPGATPVTGDWNGSGTTKVGVFLDGLWFLDLNGNGVWDEGDLWAKLGTDGRSAGHRRLGRRRQDRHRHLRPGLGRRLPGDRGRAGPARRRTNPPRGSRPKNMPPDPGRRRRRLAHA